MQVQNQVMKKAEEALESLENLQKELKDAYNRHAVLESKFKPMHARKVSAAIAEKLTATAAKTQTESQLSNEESYAEYVALPIRIDGLTKTIKIVELKLRALERIAEAQRIMRR